MNCPNIDLLNTIKKDVINYHGQKYEDQLRADDPEYDKLLTRIENNSALLHEKLNELYSKCKGPYRSYCRLYDKHQVHFHRHEKDALELGGVSKAITIIKTLDDVSLNLKHWQHKYDVIIRNIEHYNRYDARLFKDMKRLASAIADTEPDLVEEASDLHFQIYLDQEEKYNEYDHYLKPEDEEEKSVEESKKDYEYKYN